VRPRRTRTRLLLLLLWLEVAGGGTCACRRSGRRRFAGWPRRAGGPSRRSESEPLLPDPGLMLNLDDV
jgi:hypothetical protein